MTNPARTERLTQQRVVRLFTDANHPHFLGYDYLGDWQKREANSGIEVNYLKRNLEERGYSRAQVSAALQELQKAADVTRDLLYQANRRVYQLLRYGIKVKVAIDKEHEDIYLIDWENVEANHFALAEEVTLRHGSERRPDIVLYINGLAVAVLELKRGSVNINDAIQQLRTNQEEQFNAAFFSTVQYLFAGSDAHGLRYGTTGTETKYFLSWKQGGDAEPSEGYLLDQPLSQMCQKERLLDLIRNCIIFDAGIKKVPREHQYHGLKKTQERIEQRQGGVIWHTQGSGKSIFMVMLTQWLLENDPKGRVLIITDRDELDKQIEGVMQNTGVLSDSDAGTLRIQSRAEFEQKISATTPRLLCALIHKFNPDLNSLPPKAHGRFYVLVDECHRTQGGNMNKQMKQWLPDGIFIGFTGTPLLRKDKKTTGEVFGTYIHTYKFDQAVSDGVVLDLKYEARTVPQRLSSADKIDEWFTEKTRGLNGFQRAVLRKRWATMEKLMSSAGRKDRIVASIVHDFGIKPRLNNNRGTAILVAASIYDACHYYRLVRESPLGKKFGIVTSLEPNANKISKEEADSDERYKFDTYHDLVLAEGQTTKQYEDAIKKRFIEEPKEAFYRRAS